MLLTHGIHIKGQLLIPPTSDFPGPALPPSHTAGALRFAPHLQLRIERSFRHRHLQDAKRRLRNRSRRCFQMGGTGYPNSWLIKIYINHDYNRTSY